MKNFFRKIIPNFLFSWYHLAWAFLGALIYGFPSRKIKIIGVTGTNGKSTTAFLISRILEEAGYKVGLISSIKFKIDKKEWFNTLKMTMPGRMKIQKFLRQAVKADCQYAVLEVTSEGIKQNRHRFISFNAAVLTNLRPEHIESHGSFEKYKEAKGKLFKALKSKGKIIVNLDEPDAGFFLGLKADEKWGYGIKSKIKSQNLILGEGCQFESNGISFRVRDTEFKLSLLGEFNIYNALAAICAGLSLEIPLEKIKFALEKIKGIPGRMEIVIKEPFTVIVDYAHTPDALLSVYKTLKNSKLICVLGAAGGGRDKWKRPEIGKIAAQYCRSIILTNEDPYDEDPKSILEEIGLGFSQIKNPRPKIQKIIDRREAIREALKNAKPGDSVIITGKGCEPWISAAGGKKLPWDDREIVREEFKKVE